MSQVIQHIKAKRMAIADLEQTLATAPEQSFFLSNATMWLALARGWLGKMLGALGEANPYPESLNPQSPVIEPASYQKPEVLVPFGDEPVAGIKGLRQGIEKIASDAWPWTPSDGEERAAFCQNQYSAALQNAKMCLGEELGKIRDSDASRYTR